MDEYIEILFKEVESLHREILVARLNEIGFDGFEEGTDWINAYINKARFSEEALQEAVIDLRLHYERSIVPNINWNAQWEKNFEPVEIPGFCRVRAPFHAANSDFRYELVIMPKMSFGTGHHATTCMMLELMQPIDFTAKHVLDFGTGTGILAILAEKMGASSIVCIDNDNRSIDNAAENFQENICRNVKLFKSDTIPGNERFDVILANVSRSVVLANLKFMKQQLANGGVVLVSGFLHSDEEEIGNTALKCGLKMVERRLQQDWLAFKLTGN